ncbi:hypothetical protein C8J56DRAFT_890784 [Mycena floridula]|nr:hypothetical protein C8J56DRAFT_890784 [Mycena floridula]
MQLKLGSLGTIHGSVFSNNQVYPHHHHPQANDDDDEEDVRVLSFNIPVVWFIHNFQYAEIKVRDIILETELGSGDIHHDLQSDGTLVEIGWIQKYIGQLFYQPHGSMLIHKYEGETTGVWKSHLNMLSALKHPNIIQLYGLRRPRHFPALIFHNEYHLSLSGPSFVTFVADLYFQVSQTEKDKLAMNALQGYALHPLDNAQIPFKVEFISDMLRCTIPISQLQNMSDRGHMFIAVQAQKSSDHASSPLFHVFATQIHHIIETMKMKMGASEVLTVMPYHLDFHYGLIKPTPLSHDGLYLWHALQHPDHENHWWSTDPEGSNSYINYSGGRGF